MRLPLSTLPLPLTLVLLTATAALPAPAPVTSSSTLSLAQPSGFIKPRFLPPANYRRQKRQDGASSGQGGLTATSEADAGTGGGDTAQTSAAAVTTTEAAPTTTQEQPQSTTQAPETTSQAEPTTTQVQTTSQAQQTPPAQTTDAQATTTSQAPPSATTSTTSAAQVPPSSTSSSSGAQVSTTPTPTTSGLSAASSAQLSSVGSKSSISNVEITFTSLFTASDGSVQTSTGTTTTPSAVPIKKDGGGSSTGKTWGIIGGVVGGVVVVGLGVFVVYRMTQRRFSSLDNDELDEIKWPELVSSGQEVSGNTSTLRPLDTHRTGGAGIGDDGASEYGGPAGGGDMGAAGIYGAVGHGRSESQSTLLDGPGGGMTHSRQASYEQLAMADSGGAYGPGAAGGGQHYDPFLGPAAYPPLNASQAQGMVYPPPHYLAGAPGSHSSHERSPSLRPQPAGAAASDGYGSPNTQDYLSRNPTMASTKFGSVYGTSGSVMGSEPRGAPGAGGAISRAASPPVGSRSEGTFRVPSPNFRTEEGLGLGLDEEGDGGEEGPVVGERSTAVKADKR